MSDLPPGWEWTTIGEIADVQLGRQRSPKNHNGPHMRPYLRSANITWSGIDTSDVKEMNFEPGEASTFELQPGDLLLNEASGSPNEVGKPAIWRGEIEGCCFQNTLLRVRPREVSTEYLYWYCRAAALSGRFGEAGRGVNIRHLGKQGLSAFPLALPPLPEHRRIVAAVEEHLSRLDAAEQSLRSARIRLATFRSATTSEALKGDWPVAPLSTHTVDQRYGSSAKASRTGDVPVLRMGNIVDGHLDFGDLKYLPADHPDLETCDLALGDLLFNRTNSPELVGKSAVFTGHPTEVTFASYLIRVRLDEELDPHWAATVINSPIGRRYIDTVRTQQVGQANVNGTKLKEFPIPIPPIQVQRDRLDQLQLARGWLESVESEISRALMRAASLRRSILTAAFSGQLVPQDPEDEPASVLLERIRAERATATTTKRIRKAKAS